MLKFLVFDDNAQPASDWPLRNAYLLGSDGNAVRCEIIYEDGEIVCEKRETGPAALALQHSVGDLGELTLQTCLLPERDEPYLLTLELARHRLMTLYTKLEDWSMFDLDAEHPVLKRANFARRKFIDALCVQGEDPAAADRLASESLSTALDGSEELALIHSELLLSRRKQAVSLPRPAVACGVSLHQANERVRTGVVANFDAVCLPTPWKVLAPEEGDYHWQLMDNWTQWAGRHRLPVIAGPAIAFDPNNLPDWLYIWEHDYDTVRDLIYEHVERLVSRYRDNIAAWNIASGLHVNSHFTFNFEQLMDLTRMTTMLVKKIQPAARCLVEIRQPFGEYFSSNQRSIPPQMYADLMTQSGINFDALSLRLPMGQAVAGQYTRDLMQISNLLDQFSSFGKPIFLSIAAPSDRVTEAMIAGGDPEQPVDASSGCWRRPWSPTVQSHWLEAVMQVAMSKPYVEGVSWLELVDHAQMELPLGGLITEDLQAKAGLRRLIAFRRSLAGAGPEQASQVGAGSVVTGQGGDSPLPPGGGASEHQP